MRREDVRVCDEADGFEDGRAVGQGTMAPLEAGRATQADSPVELPEERRPTYTLMLALQTRFRLLTLRTRRPACVL